MVGRWGDGEAMMDAENEQVSKGLSRSHRDLEVYQLAFEAAMRIFDYSRAFLPEERYALTDQIRPTSLSPHRNQ